MVQAEMYDDATSHRSRSTWTGVVIELDIKPEMTDGWANVLWAQGTAGQISWVPTLKIEAISESG